MDNVIEAKCVRFKNPGLKQPPIFFIVVPPKEGFSYSERVEVHIAVQYGIIVLIEDEEMRIDFPIPDHDEITRFKYKREGKQVLMDIVMMA